MHGGMSNANGKNAAGDLNARGGCPEVLDGETDGTILQKESLESIENKGKMLEYMVGDIAKW